MISEETGHALQLELVDFVERFVELVDQEDWHAEHVRRLVWEEPGEAASILLCSWVGANWDLTEQELARLWLIGRACGYRSEQLVPPDVLAQHAAPGREVLPPDPEGWDLVQTPVLPGGGHGPGRGQPGKSEFPASWSDDDTIAHTMDVAMHPSGTVELPSGDFRAWGERLGVRLSVLVSPRGGVLTSYPVSGDGVVQNPLDVVRAPHVQRLQLLLDTLPESTDEPRQSLDELMTAGEWPHVITSLQALDAGWTAEQQAELAELARMAR